MHFKKFKLPTGEFFLIPKQIILKLPLRSAIKKEDLHYMVYIPWNNRFSKGIKQPYRSFFKKVLPYLKVRTTDVHTAVCLSFTEDFLKSFKESIQARVVYVALILHDSGWSKLKEKEIAGSLGVKGLALTGDSVSPKEKHAKNGVNVAKKLLSKHSFDPPLSNKEKEVIYKAVRYHDKVKDLSGAELEVKIIADLDHLWSFTYLNFWQDTVRKKISPDIYLNNLRKDLNNYFSTDAGRKKARVMLSDRQKEVKFWQIFRQNENL